MQNHDLVQITLSRSQALVLFELLARETEGTSETITLRDEAELHALWNLEGKLEKSLEEIFARDYAERLEKARQDWRTPPAG